MPPPLPTPLLISSIITQIHNHSHNSHTRKHDSNTQKHVTHFYGTNTYTERGVLTPKQLERSLRPPTTSPSNVIVVGRLAYAVLDIGEVECDIADLHAGDNERAS